MYNTPSEVGGPVLGVTALPASTPITQSVALYVSFGWIARLPVTATLRDSHCSTHTAVNWLRSSCPTSLRTGRLVALIAKWKWMNATRHAGSTTEDAEWKQAVYVFWDCTKDLQTSVSISRCSYRLLVKTFTSCSQVTPERDMCRPRPTQMKNWRLKRVVDTAPSDVPYFSSRYFSWMGVAIVLNISYFCPFWYNNHYVISVHSRTSSYCHSPHRP